MNEQSLCINVTSNDRSESTCAPQLCVGTSWATAFVCILTPWFSHPVSLWHWDRRRAAWQKWLSAWCGPSAGQTFPVLCGEGIRTSVAIPVRGERERDSGLHSITTGLESLHLLENTEKRQNIATEKQDDKWQKYLRLIQEVVLTFWRFVQNIIHKWIIYFSVFLFAAALNFHLSPSFCIWLHSVPHANSHSIHFYSTYFAKCLKAPQNFLHSSGWSTFTQGYQNSTC